MSNYLKYWNERLEDLTGSHWDLSVNRSELECKAIYALNSFAIWNAFLLDEYDPWFGFGVVEVIEDEDYMLIYYDRESDSCIPLRAYNSYNAVMAAYYSLICNREAYDE